MKPIYLDYNATTPISKEVAAAMRPFLDEYFGNPSSMHVFGQETRKAIEKSRKQLAALINCNASEIIFTSGGTESNNYAIKGIALKNQNKGKHIITSNIEHPAVIEVCNYLEKHGFEISYLHADTFGIVSVEELQQLIRTDTILVSVMHANNETGSIQPIKELCEVAHRNNVLFHCDAAQSLGKIKVDVNDLGVDLLSVAGHKLYAPKGIGALYIRQGIELEKLIHGADHEQNLRAGTENVLEIVGLGAAAENALNEAQERFEKLKNLRNRLESALLNAGIHAKINGHPEKRLPNTLNIAFKNVEANTLLAAMPDIAASAGAACHAENVEVSTVLEAMKIPIEYAMGTIRLSLGKYNTSQEIDEAANIIIKQVKILQGDISEPAHELSTKEIKLTQFTHGLGCACKIRPQYLERILKDIHIPNIPEVLVGIDDADDATVYQIDDDKAIVQTIDFFTPVVDDPYEFGAVAAANSLSDIYAMGAKPLFALNIVGFPDNRLPEEVLKQILKGAEDKALEAGIYILGGHTVEDPEPKFGMTVTGLIHPHKIWGNNGAKAGEILFLTKPIGTGVLSTAHKRGLIDQRDYIDSMMKLNKAASELARPFNISACTDVTGFGLLGHLMELSKASGVTALIDHKKVPVFDGVIDLIAANVIPGGTKNNLDYVSDTVEFDSQISQAYKFLLADAQTSGGLILAVDQKDGVAIQEAFAKAGEPIFEIGRLTQKSDKDIKVI